MTFSLYMKLTAVAVVAGILLAVYQFLSRPITYTVPPPEPALCLVQVIKAGSDASIYSDGQQVKLLVVMQSNGDVKIYEEEVADRKNCIEEI